MCQHVFGVWEETGVPGGNPCRHRENMQTPGRWCQGQGRTDNSWGPLAIGDYGAPVSLPTLKPHPKKPMKGTRDISWGPLLTPGPQAVPEFPNGQSLPG
ncbi:unnamed protein product, partial [Staurois parvus]